MKKNIIFLAFVTKKIIFSYAFLASLIIFFISFLTLISILPIDNAVEWITPELLFIFNLFLLGYVMFEYKKNKNFFSDKTHYNFLIIISLFIVNFLFVLDAMFCVWIAELSNVIKFENINDSYFAYRTGILTLNWAFFYYVTILMALVAFFVFEIIYKFIDKSKNYYLLILFIFAFYFIINATYLLKFPTGINFHTLKNSNSEFGKMNFNNSNQYFAYNQSNNTFYIYPYFNDSTNYKNAFRFWIIAIDPFFCFIYLFHMTAFSVTYTKEFFFYNHRFFSANGLRVKTAYFHLQLGSKYFWFMLYPYFYITFLFIIKLFINEIFKIFSKKIIFKKIY